MLMGSLTTVDMVATNVTPGDQAEHYLPYVADAIKHLASSKLRNIPTDAIAAELEQGKMAGINHQHALATQISEIVAHEKYTAADAGAAQHLSTHTPTVSGPSGTRSK